METIRVVTAKKMTPEQKYAYRIIPFPREQIVENLRRQRPGVQFTITYEVNKEILGGMELYSGNRYLDLTLKSRINKIKTELQKMRF